MRFLAPTPPTTRSQLSPASWLHSRAEDEGRSLLREVFGSPADLEVVGDELHVRINALSVPRRTRAIAALCEDLTATKTIYPGTDLTLAYSVKGPLVSPKDLSCCVKRSGICLRFGDTPDDD